MKLAEWHTRAWHELLMLPGVKDARVEPGADRPKILVEFSMEMDLEDLWTVVNQLALLRSIQLQIDRNREDSPI
jgi:hypothetical protein